MQRYGAWGEFHHFTAAGSGMGPLPIHMDSRDLRGALLNRTPERRQGSLQLGLTQLGPIPFLHQRPLQVVGAGALPQLDHPAIGLVAGQVRQQPRRRPQGNRQHSGHGRVQGAAMAHPAQPITAA